MARVVYFLDLLFGIPVTSGALGMQEGGTIAPGKALGRQHHLSGAVVGSALAIPCGDTARQDALNCASV